jgi:hypothetical protein
MEKTDTNKKDFKMRVVVRFIYRMSATPSCDIIEMDKDTWNKFLNLESTTSRINMIIKILDREYMAETIRELAWIPLDDNMDLVVHTE